MRRDGSLLPALVLLAWGIAFGMSALGTGPLGFDDHPGQLARLIHALEAGPAPWAWHAGWWGGYPELQFYPPGWFYAGTVLSWLTLGTLPAATIYQTLLWVTWLAPGLTAWALLRGVLGDGWLALPGGLLVLTFAGDPGGGSPSGVEGGVRIGMVAARFAWALLPGLALSLVRWSARPERVPYGATLLVAAIVLTHPSHTPAALAIVAGAALASVPAARALGRASLAVVFAVLLVAFWALPLAWHLAHTRALAWGELGLRALGTPFGLMLMALVVVALAWPATRALGYALGLGALAVAADALIVEPLGLRFLPADRVADGVWMLALLLAGAGMGRIAIAARGWGPPAVVAMAMLLVLAAASVPTRALALWPRPADWPSLPAIARGLRVDALWTALREAPPGRVLFIRSSVPLVYGDAWYRPHSHVTALTPARAGRAMLGGTFTHGAPVAALLYRGDTSPAPIARLAERLDGVTLLGQPLERLDPATLDRVTRRFGVAVIVAMEDDLPRLGHLADGPRYRRITVPPFVLFVGGDVPEPARRQDDDRWRVTVPDDEWASTGVAFYPLWRAEQDGHALLTRRGADAVLEVKPARAGAVVLVYGPGAAELVGLGISLATAAGIGAHAWRRRRAPLA